MAYHPYHFVGEVLLHPVVLLIAIRPYDGDIKFGLLSIFYRKYLHIQGVTGPHRQNDRDDRICREDHFFKGTYTRKHVVYELCAGEGVRP